MDIPLHNTAIKRQASLNFETNAIRVADFKVDDSIKPIVDLQPYNNFIVTGTATATLIDASSGIYKNRQVYITGLHISGVTTIGDQVQIAFVLDDKSNPSIFEFFTPNSSHSVSISFGNKGILLDKNNNQAINIVVGTNMDNASIEIWGYTGSDRSQ